MFGLLVVPHSTVSAQAQPVDLDAAKREGKVVVYGSVVPQAMDELRGAGLPEPLGEQPPLLGRWRRLKEYRSMSGEESW